MFPILPIPCSHLNVNGCIARPGLFFQRQSGIVELLRVLPNTSYPKKHFLAAGFKPRPFRLFPPQTTASFMAWWAIQLNLKYTYSKMAAHIPNDIFLVGLKYQCYICYKFCHSRTGRALMPVSFIMTVPAGILFGNLAHIFKLAKHPFLCEENQ